MTDRNKTKQELISELVQMRQEMAAVAALKIGQGPSDGIWSLSQQSAAILLNMMVDAAVLISTDGILLCLNQVAAEKLGEPPDGLVGGSTFELLPPDVAAERRSTKSIEAVRSGTQIRSPWMWREDFGTETLGQSCRLH